MDVSTAIDSRMSCRAFLPTPVPETTVRAILAAATRAPSGGNLQPWHCYVLTGEPPGPLPRHDPWPSRPASVGLFFCIDRQMGPPQWADLGMYMQSVMLLAREQGLHTCPQEAWAVWHEAVTQFLSLPPELMLFSGMALGHRDESAPINSLRTNRARLEDFASLQGVSCVGKPDKPS